MHLSFPNVNSAFRTFVRRIRDGAIPTEVMPSRVGEILRIREPVTITYENPTQRVLFNSARDCNPFFHLYESLWMLAGREDLAPLQYYVSTFGNFSDDGRTLHGAYGYRWRHQFGYDQLEEIVKEIRSNPWTRRCVLQMWDAKDTKVEDPTSDYRSKPDKYSDPWMAVNGGKDVPCNLCALFDVEPGTCRECDGTGYASPESPEVQSLGRPMQFPPKCLSCNGTPHDQPRYLNMTVFNRSNDLIWGTLGANVVHFSVLQEYLAAACRLEVGVYNQISNNQHVYTERWKPDEWLEDQDNKIFGYHRGSNPHPLVSDPKTFLREVEDFVNPDLLDGDYSEPFLRYTARPLLIAFRFHKDRNYDVALHYVEQVRADDWRKAGKLWLRKRAERFAAKRG